MGNRLLRFAGHEQQHWSVESMRVHKWLEPLVVAVGATGVRKGTQHESLIVNGGEEVSEVLWHCTVERDAVEAKFAFQCCVKWDPDMQSPVLSSCSALWMEQSVS